MIEIPVSFVPSPTYPRRQLSTTRSVALHIDDYPVASSFGHVTMTSSQLPRHLPDFHPSAAIDRLGSTATTPPLPLPLSVGTDPLPQLNAMLPSTSTLGAAPACTSAVSDDSRLVTGRPVSGGSDDVAVGCPMDVDEFFDDEEDLDAEVCHFLSRVQPDVDPDYVVDEGTLGEESRCHRDDDDDANVGNASSTTIQRYDGAVDVEVSARGRPDETGRLQMDAAVGLPRVDVRRRCRPACSTLLGRCRRHRDGCQVTVDDGDHSARPCLNFEKMQRKTLHVLPCIRRPLRVATIDSFKFRQVYQAALDVKRTCRARVV